MMSDRIIATKCPHCRKITVVFIMLGQTFVDECEHCKKKIYFDDFGNVYKTMTKKELNRLVQERNTYYENLIKRYSK